MTKKHHDDEPLETPKHVEELKEQAPKGAQSIESLTAELAEAKAKADENWQKVLRTHAELENVERRAKRDVEAAHKFALQQFAKELLPVVDSLEQGLQVEGEGEALVKSLREGMEMTLKMLVDTLKKFNIEQVSPLNQAFDPELHEAMSMQPSDEHAPNTVVAVFQKGYTLHGRLIRPARVVVSTAK